MRTPAKHQPKAQIGESGQVLAIGVVLTLVLIIMSALVLEGGNAYAQQRRTQNGADAAANAGAVVLAERLGGATRTDADVMAMVSSVAGANQLTAFTALYTDVSGRPLDSAGAVAALSLQPAAAVGGGAIPSNAQGVQVGGTRTFGTILGGVINLSSFDASADATAVTGRLVGGGFLPVIFPISISDCDQSGVTQPFSQAQWETSDAPAIPGGYPDGPEYIIPICKTNLQGGGGGSFQILDLDPTMSCEEEAADPPAVYWESFPVQVPVDNGNNCAGPIADVVNAELHLEPVVIPICQADCVPSNSGSNATYEIIGVTAFYIDWMFDQNSGQDHPDCQGGTGSGGQTLINVVGGNGSSSCVHGWFIQFITDGPVGTGPVGETDAIGVQLIL